MTVHNASTTAEGLKNQTSGRVPAPGSELFPVVGIGASAGGFTATQKLLGALPCDTGMAFVLVQHLSPRYHSSLAELLDKATAMPVRAIENDMPMEPDTVYVIPPGQTLFLEGRTLKLAPRDSSPGLSLTIDKFFLSLAANLQESAIGVVLSGTGSDGTQGIKAIKSEGGITFAQLESSAEFPEMPRHAIEAGKVDFVLTPEAIGQEITRLSRHPLLQAQLMAQGTLPGPSDTEVIERILLQLKALGADFIHYKRSTISRRILRRMAINKLTELTDYADFLQQHPEEAAALREDMLIKVTSFFRDPLVFDALKASVYPAIVQGKEEDSAVRVWVPGCASGQEAYSIVMSLLEFFEEQGKSAPIQVFGTDISDQAIDKARRGIFTTAEVAELSPARLRTFFTKVNDGYQVTKPVRDLCIFAQQDFTQDPPFSRLDLISCRNVLIYFGTSLQKKVLPIFHYALRPGGFLLLGASESIGSFEALFAAADKKNRIFSKKGGSPPTAPESQTAPSLAGPKRPPQLTHAGPPAKPPDLKAATDRILLRKYNPAAVVIDQEMTILHFRGDTGPYLQPLPGKASLNLLKMAHDDLRLELRTLIHRAQKEQVPQRRDGLRVGHHDGFQHIDLEVTPFVHDGEAPLYLVQFEPALLPSASGEGVESRHDIEGVDPQKELLQLRQDLYLTRDYMQTLVEEREEALEDIKTANQEILSSNEELQSINEEMETAKEELESSNEELTTVNIELQSRNEELAQAHSDLHNLLLSAQIPFIIVETDLRIRLVGPHTEKTLHVAPSDIGRLITEFQRHFPLPELAEPLGEVIATGQIFEKEVTDPSGAWNLLRIYPYKAADNTRQGAVITLFDIDRLKKSQEEIATAHKHALRIVDTIKDPLLVLDPELRVRTANPGFYEKFQVSPQQTEGRCVYELGVGQWNNPELRRLLEEILPKSTQMDNFLVNFYFPHLGQRSMLLSAHKMRSREAERESILLAFQDVTERLHLEEDLRRAKCEAEKASRVKSEFLANMSHEIRTPLTVILSALQHINKTGLDPESARCLKMADTASEALMTLLDDILDFSRIEAEKLSLEQAPFELHDCVSTAIDSLRLKAQTKGLDLTLDIASAVPKRVIGDQTRLRQVLINLVSNAIKFTEKGNVAVCVAPAAELTGSGLPQLRFSVRDTGIGISPESAEHVFERFTQADSSSTRKYGGTGLGLAICKAIVERMGGKIEVESAVGQGSTFSFTISLPVAFETAATSEEKLKLQLLDKSAAEPTTSRRIRVLLGEDDSAIQELVKLLLRKNGYEVVVAADGKKVVDTWKSGNFDLILMDAHMPELDGFAAAQQIRAKEKTTGGHIPIIALTADASKEGQERALKEGMDGFLTKPIRVAALYAAIENHVEPKGSVATEPNPRV